LLDVYGGLLCACVLGVFWYFFADPIFDMIVDKPCVMMMMIAICLLTALCALAVSSVYTVFCAVVLPVGAPHLDADHSVDW
jgi:hypothetical protein